VKDASGREAARFGFAPANFQHWGGRLDHYELPLWKFLREIYQLRPRAGADTKNSRVGGQISQHGTDEQMQGIAHGRQFGVALVVGGGVFRAEGDGWLGALHYWEA
jgi:hypothetical protein